MSDLMLVIIVGIFYAIYIYGLHFIYSFLVAYNIKDAS